MNSDELFWHLVLARRNPDEAALMWWLMRAQAETRRRLIEPAVITRHFGFGRMRLQRARETLQANGLVRCFVAKDRSTEYELVAPVVLDALRAAAAQNGTTDRNAAMPHCLGHFVTVDSTDNRHVLTQSKDAARLVLLLQSRSQAILLSCLMAMGGEESHPLKMSTRRLEQELGGYVDRRTAMRALALLQAADLVTVASRGRAGTEYQLNRPTLDALLQAPCPWGPDAGLQIPGWSLHQFPMLDKIAGVVAQATEEARLAIARRASEPATHAEMAKEIEC